MAKLESLGQVIEADVLVIGGGASGLWAANRARALGSDVFVVDKGPVDWGGLAALSGGDLDAVVPGESVDDWLRDLVYYYDGLCEQDLFEVVFKHSYERLRDYQRFGCEFMTGPDGKLRGIPQRGLEHIKLYPARVKGTGGTDMIKGLVGETERLGVRRLGRTLVTDLLKRDGRVVGAVGFDTRSGRFYIFKARAVVLASGEGGWKQSYHSHTATAEGTLMAFRAGAALKNFEFVRVWNLPAQFAWESQTTLIPLGARFVNARGEPFMDKYCPGLSGKTDQHYNVIGMCYEAREGRAPIYFDVSPMKPEDREMVKPQSGWQRLNYRKLKDIGIDFFTDNVAWQPLLLYTCGGLTADIEGRTGVPGLFVTGCARSIEPGLCIGGLHLCVTAVTGHITGAVAAAYAREQRPTPVEADEAAACRERLLAPLGQPGIAPKEVLTEIQKLVFPYEVCIVKSEASLKGALAKFEKLQREVLPQMTAADTHHLLKAAEVRAIAFMTELYLRASLMRTETRAGHYREDFPDRDDEKWLKWLVIRQKDGGGLDFTPEPVPVERYRFKPERYYMDNFRLPRRG